MTVDMPVATSSGIPPLENIGEPEPRGTFASAFFPVVRSSDRSIVLVSFHHSTAKVICFVESPLPAERPNTRWTPWAMTVPALLRWRGAIRLTLPPAPLRVHRASEEDDYSPAEGVEALRHLPVAAASHNVVHLNVWKRKG
jgi:hypothetical protein